MHKSIRQVVLGLALQSLAAAACRADAAPAIALTPAGEALKTQYAATLAALQAEIAPTLPKVDEPKKAAFLSARGAVAKATAAASAAKQPLDKIEGAKALVEHAKGKWIGGAEKDIARAEAALKKAGTDAERETAQKDLVKYQADLEAGKKALVERQAALDQARAEEAKYVEANQAAQAALSLARSNELAAAKVMVADVMPFLASDKLDAKLAKCAVLAQATPAGLAEFAQQGQEQAALVETLLSDAALMEAMLEAGGARGGRYGQALQIYTGIQKASPRAAKGILQRLALGTALHCAVPQPQRNAVTETNAPTVVDPVKRYLHYEKAYLAGELDPAFKDMSAWQCRMIINSEAPDHILAWGREMLRNYRPDHVVNPDYGWRYSGVVRTDVAYRHSQEYQDTDSLQFFQNIIKNGGICGRRAFFGRFIVKSFGLPSWGVAQHAHAALGRWTPSGWVVNFGAGWEWSWSDADTPFDKYRGPDFVLEAQAREHPGDYLKVLRAQWVGDILGEQRIDSFKEGSGGLWNVMAYFEKKAIVADAKPVALAALGQELGEANETPAARALAVTNATVTAAERQVAVAPDGVVTIPAAACGGAVQPMASVLGGLQAFCSGTFTCRVEAAKAGRYTLTARVVTVHDEGHLRVTANGAGEAADMVIPFTCGRWEKTRPVEITLAQGRNELTFAEPTRGFTLKDITLAPAGRTGN